MIRFSALFLSLGLVACAASTPRSADATLTSVNPPPGPDLGHHPTEVQVEIFHMYATEVIQKHCEGTVPFFEFDSAKVEQEDKSSMRNLARCMKDGALKGKNILITGRADPRGTEQYNEKLGLERAEKVKAYLVRQGIDAARVKTASLGEKDASPSPKDWPTDRRVQIDEIP